MCIIAHIPLDRAVAAKGVWSTDGVRGKTRMQNVLELFVATQQMYLPRSFYSAHPVWQRRVPSANPALALS